MPWADYDGFVQGDPEVDTMVLLGQAQEAVRAGEWSAAKVRSRRPADPAGLKLIWERNRS
jgi:hypothetical protein